MQLFSLHRLLRPEGLKRLMEAYLMFLEHIPKRKWRKESKMALETQFEQS